MIGNSLLIKQLVNTEKSTLLKNSFAKYCFLVHPDATKDSIVSFLKKNFNVDVSKVNVVNYKQKVVSFRNKYGVTSGFKKAYVTLKNKTDVINFDSLKV
jgi:large subunit ribosomal protein L23